VLCLSSETRRHIARYSCMYSLCYRPIAFLPNYGGLVIFNPFGMLAERDDILIFYVEFEMSMSISHQVWRMCRLASRIQGRLSYR